MSDQPKDFPLIACAIRARPIIDKGGTIYQKFTCSNCGSRQTMDVPNTFYESGKCEECGKLTDITKTGCNFLVHIVLGK